MSMTSKRFVFLEVTYTCSLIACAMPVAQVGLIFALMHTIHNSRPSSAFLHSFSYIGKPPGKLSCSLGLPGMLAPMYQDSVPGNKVLSESSVTSLCQLVSASLCGNGINNPVALHLDTGGAVTEGGGTLSTVQEEHVLRGLSYQVLAFGILQAHVLHATSNRVEASSESNDVKLSELTVASNDTSLCKFGDGCLSDVDNIVLGLVHQLIKVLLQRRTLGSPGVGSLERSEDITLARIGNASSGLLSPEVVGLVVGLAVEQQVLVVCKPELEAAFFPQLLVELLALFLINPAKVRFAAPPWSSRVDAWANRGWVNTLALDVDTLVRPERAVVQLALEVGKTLPVREVALGCEANGVDEVLALCGAAVLGLDADILLNVKGVFDMNEVFTELVEVRVLLGPCPVFPDLLDRVFVNGDLCINAGSWVAVPSPNTTKLVCGFEDLDIQTDLVTKLVKQIDTTKTGTNDENIAGEFFGICAHQCLFVSVP
ncbi:FAD/NAD(P)-binding domain-containing protein, partial [Aureobasidium melanogenum]